MRLKIQLFILSLWLLFILLFINKIDLSHCFIDGDFIGLKALLLKNIIPSICLILIIAGLIFYYRFKYIVKGAKSLPDRIKNVDNLNWEHLTFLVTYVVPLLSFDLDFDLTKNRNGLMLFLVLVIIGLIYVKTNMFYNNPTLAILGYHIYKVDTDKKSKIILISRSVLNDEDWVEYRLISDNIYFATLTKKP